MQIESGLRKVQTVFGVVSGAVLFTSMLIVTADVMVRFFFGMPIYGVTEIVTIILPLVIFRFFLKKIEMVALTSKSSLITVR